MQSACNRLPNKCANLLYSQSKIRQIPSVELSRINPPAFDGAQDIADLTYLNEASVVHNLRTRYHDGAIYVSPRGWWQIAIIAD